jgi:hypothetical protein
MIAARAPLELSMLTAKDFRRIVLGLRDTVEGAHMEHPDFRVNGRIFASLNHDETRGMVILTLEDQARFIREHPSTFEPESGAWGRAGCTRIHLAAADEETLGEALTLAWQFGVAKGPTRSRTKQTRTPAKDTTSTRTTTRPRSSRKASTRPTSAPRPATRTTTRKRGRRT